MPPAAAVAGERQRMSTIVLATERAVPGGAQQALRLIAAPMRERGWDVRALVGEPGPLVDDLLAGGIGTTVTPDPAALGDFGANVVLSMGASGHAWAGPAADRLGIPAAWWLELTLRGRPRERDAIAVPAAVAAAPTQAAAAALRQHAPQLPVEVVAPGAAWGDIARHRRAAPALRRSIGLGPDGPPLLGMIARLDPVKGQDTAIDAVAALRSQGRDVHLALVGGALIGHEGDIADRLQRQAQDRGVADLVHHLGFVEDPGPWLAASTLAVQASAHEAFGLSVVEALAHGLPVIASATDGPTEILGDGAFGVLTPPGDAEALAAAVGGLLDDAERRSELAERGPRRAGEFTPEAAARRWDAVLRGVLAGPGRPSDGR